MAGPAAPADTGVVQMLWFTPRSPVCDLVNACAGPVEIVEDEHDRCLMQDHSRIYRVRSLMTGTTCWAYITELTVESAA